MNKQYEYVLSEKILVIIALVIILLLTEFVIITSELLKPCNFIGREAMNDVDFFTQWMVCFEYRSLEYDSKIPIKVYTPNQNGEFVNINSFGFRGDEISLEKDPSSYRVMIVGGSTTFGIPSTSDSATIPAYLEKIFHNDGLDFVEVINAGVTGHNSLSEAFYIKEKLVKFEPDLIIMIDGGNDVHDRISPTKLVKSDDLVTYYENKEKQDTRVTGIKSFVYDMNYKTGQLLIEYFNSQFKEKKSYSSESYGTYTEIVNSVTIRNWIDVCEYGKNNGFSTIPILQPILGISERNITPDEEKIEITDYGFNTIKYLKNIPLDDTVLNNSCEMIIDARNAFSEIDESIYLDSIHSNEFSNQIMAGKIYEKLKPFVIAKSTLES